MEREIKPYTIYRHFKGGRVLILNIAKHSETDEILIVYCCLDKESGELIYARPLSSFLSKVDKEKYPDCHQEYRFEKII